MIIITACMVHTTIVHDCICIAHKMIMIDVVVDAVVVFRCVYQGGYVLRGSGHEAATYN